MKTKELITVAFIAITFLVGSQFLSSCSASKKHDRIGTNEYTIKLGEDKMFFLDSMTTQESDYMQLIDSNRLAIYNKPENTICIFDISTEKEIKKVKLYKEGPNSVIATQGFYYQSKDSIWLYRTWQQELILVNESGEIKDKKILKDKLFPISKQTYSVSPYPFTDLPILKVGNILILHGKNGPEVESGLQPATTILYDLNSDDLRLVNPYPAIYGEPINEKWGTFTYRTTPYTLNPKNEMVLSFPADDSISVYNITTDTYMKFFAGYSLETNIEPLPLNSSQTDFQEQYLEQYQYVGILYDKYHNLYYRLVMLPTFDYDLNTFSTQHKEIAVIILNSSFEKVGEYNLNRAYYKIRNVFVSKEGLHINVQSDDDDYLKFITLNVLKNEN